MVQWLTATTCSLVQSFWQASWHGYCAVVTTRVSSPSHWSSKLISPARPQDMSTQRLRPESRTCVYLADLSIVLKMPLCFVSTEA
jgi:hypothetical protein